MIGLDLGSTRAKMVRVVDGEVSIRREVPSPRWRELLEMIEEGATGELISLTDDKKQISIRVE